MFERNLAVGYRDPMWPEEIVPGWLVFTVSGVLMLVFIWLYPLILAWWGGDETYFNVEKSGHIQTIESVNDPAYVSFVFLYLDKLCPFEEPNGAAYIECIQDVVNQKENAYSKDARESKEMSKYCRSVAVDPEGLVSEEIYLSCLAYKLSN